MLHKNSLSDASNIRDTEFAEGKCIVPGCHHEGWVPRLPAGDRAGRRHRYSFANSSGLRPERTNSAIRRLNSAGSAMGCSPKWENSGCYGTFYEAVPVKPAALRRTDPMTD